jgi:hypothetical protein
MYGFAHGRLTLFGTAARGRTVPIGPTVFGVCRLPSDPIGTTTVTFTGVHVNSEIRVYLPDGTEAAGVENCSADHALSWNVYAFGSANNTVTIRIVNVAYKIKEFTYTASAGNVSIPIQQDLDPWYSNP